MISNLNSAAQQFLNGIDQVQQQAARAQQQITSGLRIATVSDAPGDLAQLLQTKSILSTAQQIDKNLINVSTQVNTSETALESAVNLVEQAQTLGAQAQSNINSGTTQQTLADQLGTILQQLGSIANTNVSGRYVFAGDSDQTQPYTVDLTQPNPISAYAGSTSTRQVQSADGSLFSVALTAQDIFDNPDATRSVFQSISSLRTAILNGDQTGAATALANVGSSDTFLNQQLAFYGNVQDQVTNATNFGANYETQLTAQVSGIQDADLTQAITQFTQANTDEQAALAAEAKVPTQSLFSYLA